jgi:hypothetical protein
VVTSAGTKYRFSRRLQVYPQGMINSNASGMVPTAGEQTETEVDDLAFCLWMEEGVQRTIRKDANLAYIGPDGPAECSTVNPLN